MKRPVEEAAALPYAELVIRPGDTRPIVISFSIEGDDAGGVHITDGDIGDMEEAKFVLNFMMNAAGDEAWERIQSRLPIRVLRVTVAEIDPDDLPF